MSDPELLRESAPAVAQGWNSFVSFSPDKKILVSVTQFGDSSIFIAWLHKSI